MEHMESKMQDRFDAWDAQMAAADADLKAYVALMRNPDAFDAFIAIEKAWDLFGYAPEIVCTVLHAVAGGQGFDAALDAVLSSHPNAAVAPVGAAGNLATDEPKPSLLKAMETTTDKGDPANAE